VATLVFLHAHPDDECLITGGTLALAAADGHRTVLVVATNGDHGEVPDDLAPGASFTIRWRVRDVSGVSFTTAFVTSPTGAHVSGCGGSAAVRTSGTDLDGIYSQTCTLSVSARAGTYTVRIQAFDESGNQISGGANATFTVTVPTTTTSTTTTTTTTLPTESTVPG
jgi:hypothetical protein